MLRCIWGLNAGLHMIPLLPQVAAGFLMRAKHFNRRKVDDLLTAASRKAEIMQASMRPRWVTEPEF